MDIPEYYELFKKQKSITRSSWGGYALDIRLWEEEESPIIKLRHINKTEFDDFEGYGFLSDRLIGFASSFLTKSPETGFYILGKFIMRNMSLTNITVLHYHRYLQYIDLAYNNLTNLKSLSGIPYLLYLNASHNKLTDILNFTPPWYLTYVNLSYNHITQMSDLSSFWSIVRLDLSHNKIEVIFGLQNLKYLQYLNLSYNLIEHIENLDNLNIQELNLEGNCITSYKCNESDSGIKSLINLKSIILGYNKLSNLDFLKDALSLRFIDLKFNKITDLLEVSNLKGSIYEVDLRGNSCVKWPNYRDVIVFSIPSIMFIDGVEVTVSEKISATTLFAPSPSLIAARSITKLTLLEHLNIPKIGPQIIAYDQVSPPLIILTGPSAVKKSELALHVSCELHNKIKYCKWYTTKQIEMCENEENTFVYVKREDFNEIAYCGDFLAIQELLGHSYGFHINEITSLIIEQKIGITQTDLHATIQICNRYLNAKPILVITSDVALHQTWIQNKFDIYTWIKDSIGDLLAVNVGKHMQMKKESKSSILNFIVDIVEQVIDNLELPDYSMFVRPQGTGATTMDIIYESKTMMPKMLKFQDKSSLENKDEKSYELKIILDEESNIIIHDPKHRHRRLQMRTSYKDKEIEEAECLSDDDDSNFNSSEETLLDLYNKKSNTEKPEDLKRMYVKLVLQTRKIYLEHHEKNPGFFSLVLLTDNYIEAFNILINFINKTYVKQSLPSLKYTPEINYFMQVALPDHIQYTVDKMKETLSTAKIRQKKLLRTDSKQIRNFVKSLNESEDI